MWELIVRLLQCPDTYLLSHCFWICLLYLKMLSSHWIPSALQYLRTMPSNLCLPPKTQLMHFVTAATWDKTMHSASHSCRVWTQLGSWHGETRSPRRSSRSFSREQSRYDLRCWGLSFFGSREKFSCAVKRFCAQRRLRAFTTTANTNKRRASLQNELW